MLGFNKQTFGIVFPCLVLVALQSTVHGQEPKRLNDIVNLDRFVSAGTFGIVVNDFSKATVESENYSKLSKSLGDRKSLRSFVDKLKHGEHVLGVAIYLNQRYPDKKCSPITNGFAMTDLATIPVDFFVDGQKKTINVSSLTFGRILHDHWRQELELFDAPRDKKHD